MIGERLKMYRKMRGLSQRQLVAKMDGQVSAMSISKYENNKATPRSGVLIALADALQVTPDALASQSEIQLGDVRIVRVCQIKGK